MMPFWKSKKRLTGKRRSKKVLGKRFLTAVKQRFTVIKRNPFFAVKYDQVRCFKVDKFPCLIHYKVEEGPRQVTVVGVLNTSLDPDTHWKKNHE